MTCLSMEADWALVRRVAEGLPFLGERWPMVTSKRDPVGLDFEIAPHEQ